MSRNFIVIDLMLSERVYMKDRERRFDLPNVVVYGMLLPSLPAGITLNNNRNYGLKYYESKGMETLTITRMDSIAKNNIRKQLLQKEIHTQISTDRSYRNHSAVIESVG